ncbi:MAG: hypothetical protein Q4C64_02310 [Erysipelotrichia bacterium]|nr:hypothetical protein [Erysipelotrichia bacterium]
MSEARNRANAKFNKLHTQTVTVRLHNENDKDIIEYLKTKENKQGYIKELIRQDMRGKGIKLI